MLEIRNIVKAYKPKKGQKVLALNGVSLVFRDKGMVFILGKSGSGKSTLLNILGGLDRCDSGEIIIKGKSSEDFSQADFDSYRNTYVGFVFQEYNILEDFTVGANIALALELQGKKATNDIINAILDEVDLVGYGSRKPNELSGGQMQRVAIARALVKNPEIILADEPTGALDSKTGIQVFETLKKLSKEKLVIVVSHDRDYAEQFGDRVIELADGKVISDIEKYQATSKPISQGVSVVDDNILYVKKGYQLTTNDVQMINEFLSKIDNDAIISMDEKTNRQFKKIARIDDEGNKESFRPTDNENINIYGKNIFRLLKSRLPLKESVKIGASGLKVKPFRLFLTILLSLIAFSLFGLADTMSSYNKVNTTVNSISDSNIRNLSLRKEMLTKDEYGNYYQDVNMDDSDIELLNEQLGVKLKPVFNFYYTSNHMESIFNFYDESKLGDLWYGYYKRAIAGLAEFTENEITDLGFTIIGRMPEKEDEIAITKYLYEHFETAGYQNSSKTFYIKPEDVNSENDIIGEKISIFNKEFTITGIIDTKLDTNRYESFKNTREIQIIDYVKITEYQTVINYGYHALGYIKPGLLDKLALEMIPEKMQIYIDKIGYYFYKVVGLDAFENNQIIFVDNGKESLNDNEILLSAEVYLNSLEIDWSSIEPIDNEFPQYEFYNYFFHEIRVGAIYEYAENNYLTALDNGFKPETMGYYGDNLTEDEKILAYRDFLIYSYGYYSNPYGDKAGIDIEWEVKGEIIKKYNLIQSNISDVLLDYYFYDGDYEQRTKNVNVVGCYIPNSKKYDVIVSEPLYAEYLEILPSKYSWAIDQMPSDVEDIRKIVEFTYKEGTDNYILQNEVSFLLGQVNNFIENAAHVFLYIGIGFAVFSSLLLFNFITLSISYKKREIGILRALGARSSDVFGIFFNESLIIALINFALALVVTIGSVIYINSYLRSEYGLLITILNFGLRQVALMLLVSVLVAFVSSFIPVYRIARKKPIDAIRNR